ncbi:hypothetical protein ABBQ38_009842 [Trebouxia sp. C0009 RCD-2024]
MLPASTLQQKLQKCQSQPGKGLWKSSAVQESLSAPLQSSCCLSQNTNLKVCIHAARPEQQPAATSSHEEEEDQADSLEQAARSLDSEAGVGYWTDYLKTFLHPRSLFQLPGVWQGQGRFGAFGEGRGLFGASETRDDVMDRVRYWVEECDTFQGFQCFVDDHSGFGHFAADVVAELKQDYSTAPVLVFPVRTTHAAPSQAQTDAKRLWKLNEALSLALLSPVASLYAPVAPPSGPRALPHLAWRPDRAFHTGALCASALDSVTLPYRLHRPCPTSPLGAATGEANMHDLTSLLSGAAHCSLGAVSAALPCPGLPEERQLAEARDHRTRHRPDSPSSRSQSAALWTRVSTACWSPGMQGSVGQALAESIVLRGARQGGAPLQAAQAADLLDQSLLLEGERCVQARCVVPQAMPVPLPYPAIFKPSVLRYGDLLPQQPSPATDSVGVVSHSNGRSHAPAEVDSIPVLTRLTASSACRQPAQQYMDNLFGRGHIGVTRQMLGRCGYDHDEHVEITEQLHQLAIGELEDDDWSD